jgi:hypothetical protein
MPLLRYFIYVGGALVALLFVASYVFPETPTLPAHDASKPMIRIASDRVAGPPRVDFDTRPQAPRVPSPIASTPAGPREAFAQLAAPRAVPAVAPVPAPIKIEVAPARTEPRKPKVARRPDRQLIASNPFIFQPFRW